VIASAAVLSGCGVQSKLAENTTEAGTARIESTTRSETSDGSFTYRSHGVVDYRHASSDVTDEVEDGDPARTITIGGVSYSTLRDDWGRPPGKRWLRLDEDWAKDRACGGEDAEDVSFYFDVTDFGDPGLVLATLGEAGAVPTVVGRQQVREAATTHYRVKLELMAVLRHQLERSGWPADAIECLAWDEEPPVDVDVWVGDDGLARRLVETTTYDDWTWVDTIDYFDFGAPVEITPPPEDEVVSFEDWSKYVEENSGPIDEPDEPDEP
jgi:hypothetical protein